MGIDADRQIGLARTKLKALVQRAFPSITAEAQAFNAGAGLVQGDDAFVLVVADSPSPMAAALAWGGRAGATNLHVIVDAPNAELALQAQGLQPRPTIWQASGVDLVPMRSERPQVIAASEAALAEVALLESAGCEVVIEHGVVLGEVRGVEVARVVIDVDGSAVVRVGVGLYDQEAHQIMHADSSIPERLAQVRSEVLLHRRPGAGSHPLNLVARERWLRAMLVAEPALAGTDNLEAVEPVAPRNGIRDGRPASARGRIGASSALVVCATGIDLDLVPEAAAQVALGAVDEVLLVLPERDQHPVIAEMAAHLATPARLVTVPSPWTA